MDKPTPITNSISYAITGCNELFEIERLINQICMYIRPEDEIVIQLDSDHSTPEVQKFVSSFWFSSIRISSFLYPLNNDFATFKNNLKSNCHAEYIFQIDADEYLGDYIAKELPSVLDANPDIEAFHIPRINIVEGITKEYVDQQRWHVTEGRFPICVKHDAPSINFPDYQTRLFKNKPEIRWVNKVHEQLIGYTRHIQLMDSTLEPYQIQNISLLHVKTLERQIKQNIFYEQLFK